MTCEDNFYCVADCVDKFEAAHENCPCQDHCVGGCPCEYYTCAEVQTTEEPPVTEPPVTETTTEPDETTVSTVPTTTGLPDNCVMLATNAFDIAEGTKLNRIDFLDPTYEFSFEFYYSGDRNTRGYRNIIQGTLHIIMQPV